jgi:tRNA pseudouridine-54 N-methylase
LDKVSNKLPNPALIRENGKDVMNDANTFVLGDDKNPTEEEMEILKKLPKISLGKESLLSSACITLIHHRLDN